MELEVVRADPAGNITLLVTGPVPPPLRPRAAVALMEAHGGEQVGFLTPPRQGGQIHLEMMGGEFCGNAARAAGYWAARTAGVQGMAAVAVEVSGAAELVTVRADTQKGTAQADMPLPLEAVQWRGQPAARFPGIVHALCSPPVPEAARARELARELAADFGAGAAGLMYLDRGEGFLQPVVYVRDTDTLFFESSCASGSAAVAFLLARAGRESAAWELRQPGGAILARAEYSDRVLRRLTIGGSVRIQETFRARIEL